MDTWTDQNDYDQSRADLEALREQMEQTWTWPTWAAPSEPERDTDGLTMLERASLEVGIAADAALRARNAWVAALPHLTDGLHCTNCGAGAEFGDLIVREIGYERWTRCDIDDTDDGPQLSPSTDGWDDISEGGSHEWVHCQTCDTAHQMPERVEWN